MVKHKIKMRSDFHETSFLPFPWTFDILLPPTFSFSLISVLDNQLHIPLPYLSHEHSVVDNHLPYPPPVIPAPPSLPYLSHEHVLVDEQMGGLVGQTRLDRRLRVRCKWGGEIKLVSDRQESMGMNGVPIPLLLR